MNQIKVTGLDTELIYEAYKDPYWDNPDNNTESYSIKITINEKDTFNAFVKFMEDLSNLASGGASREIGITDPSDDAERNMKFWVDGDGNTRLKVEE